MYLHLPISSKFALNTQRATEDFASKQPETTTGFPLHQPAVTPPTTRTSSGSIAGTPVLRRQWQWPTKDDPSSTGRSAQPCAATTLPSCHHIKEPGRIWEANTTRMHCSLSRPASASILQHKRCWTHATGCINSYGQTTQARRRIPSSISKSYWASNNISQARFQLPLMCASS